MKYRLTMQKFIIIINSNANANFINQLKIKKIEFFEFKKMISNLKILYDIIFIKF